MKLSIFFVILVFSIVGRSAEMKSSVPAWHPEAYEYLSAYEQAVIDQVMVPLNNQNVFEFLLMTERAHFNKCQIEAKLTPNFVRLSWYDESGFQMHVLKVPLNSAVITAGPLLADKNAYWIVFDEKNTGDRPSDIASETYTLKFYLADDGSTLNGATLESMKNTIYRGAVMGFIGAKINKPPFVAGEHVNCQ